MSRILYSLILLVLVSLITPLPVQAQQKAATKSAPSAVSDTALQQKIQEKLSKAKAGDGKFTVKVTGGVAYLSGTADVVQHKGAATRMAKASGAKKVVNNIVVSEGAKNKARQNLNQEKPRQAKVRTNS